MTHNPDKKEIVLIEFFSGIGGFAKGLEDAGFKIAQHFFSEIDKYAIANYKYNFPNAEYIGSVAHVRNIIRLVSGSIKPGPRVFIAFGSPCQDFSLAGKRAGIHGVKSSLIKYALFLVRWLKPDVFIWENVKGAYSTNAGADYWAIIQAFANLYDYRHEQQLLNTAWSLPQNRARIYHIGHLTGNRDDYGQVFPIGQESFGASERTGETTIIRTLTGGGNSGGMHSSMTLIKEPDGRIRRLTEIEWERLQGLPDDWTRFGNFDGAIKEISSTQRFKLCGNAVTKKIVELIGIKLLNT